MKILSKYLIVGLFAFGVFSCTDDFDELNISKNNPSADNLAPEAVLASSMRKAFHEDRYEFWRGVVLHAERFAQHIDGGYNGGWWVPENSYSYSEGWTQAVWESYNTSSFVNGFGGSLFANINILMDYFKANPEAPYAEQYIGIAETIRAFQFLKITDLFGDMPYVEHSNLDIPAPNFDDQKLIYDDLETILKSVVENNFSEEGSLPTMSDYDLLYKGDISKWRKFANSLRLRMALRRSMVDRSGAEVILANVVNYPLFESNDDNAWVARTQATEVLQNQYWGFFSTWPGNIPENYTWDGYTMTWGPGPGAFIPTYEIIETMKGTQLYASDVVDGGSASNNINAMAGIVDPRLDKYFMRPKGDTGAEHKGRIARANYFLDNDGFIKTIQSDDVEGEVLNYSWMHPSIWYDGGQWSPVSLDYAEVCLAMAEAVQQGIVTSSKSDVQWLEDGVTASCEKWGAITGTFPEDVSALYNASDSDDKFAIIATQRWVSAYTVPHQAYASLRRTGHPQYSYLDRTAKVTGSFVEPDGTTTPNKTIEIYAAGSTNYMLPQRMRVPDSEVSVNSNVPEENLDMKNKVWWAK